MSIELPPFLYGCPCRACARARAAADPIMTPATRREIAGRLYVCPRCSVPRCPHTLDHRLPCLGEENWERLERSAMTA